MLAYKAWRESQGRFLVSAVVLVWFCSLFILFRSGVREAPDEPYVEFVKDAIFAGGLRNLFVVFTIVLGLGGLLQERASGTAGLTLSLPAGRGRLIAARATTGFVEVCVLAALPPLVVVILSPVMGQAFPFADAVRFGIQWAAGGVVLFAVAFFFSAVLPGRYSALAGSMVTLFLYSVVVNLAIVKRVPSMNLFTVMSSERLHASTLCTSGAAALGFLSVAGWMTSRQDF